MMWHCEKIQHEQLAKAGQVWVSPDGVEYTIFSVRNTQQNRSVFGTVLAEHGHQVKAYTHDLSMDHANGKINGQKCHWVTIWNDKFVTTFTKK